MILAKAILMGGRTNLGRKSSLMLFLFLAAFLVWGSVACGKKAEEETAAAKPAAEQQAGAIKEGLNEVAGMVKVGFGKYLYVPSAQGFDIVAGGDTSALAGKEARIQAEFKRNWPSLLLANSIEVKEGEGVWTNVYTKTGEVNLDDYIDSQTRSSYEALKIESAVKSDAWEGKPAGKVFGKMEKSATPVAGAQKEAYTIVIRDAKGKEIGKVLVDNISEYAQYYIKKLRLFDQFWFYLKIKGTVDRGVRARTRELFHADVVFAGLF
jgi:hypothetical protein